MNDPFGRWMSERRGTIACWLAIARHRLLSVYLTEDGRRAFTRPDYAFAHSLCPVGVDVGYWESMLLRFLHAEQCESMWVLSEVFAGGLKAFRPTAAEWSAFAEIDINIPRRDYRQPFPAFVVVVPSGAMGPVDGLGDLVAVAGRHCVETGTFNMVLCGTGARELAFSLFTSDRDEELIERSLPDQLIAANRNAAIQVARRVFMNACLMLTAFGARRVGRDSEGDYRRAVDQSKGKRVDPAGREVFAVTAACMPEVFAIEQHIDLRAATAAPAADGSNPAHAVAPHWRRAHWANQPCGPAGSLRKLVFRRAAFIHRDRFAGDPAATTTDYRTAPNPDRSQP